MRASCTQQQVALSSVALLHRKVSCPGPLVVDVWSCDGGGVVEVFVEEVLLREVAVTWGLIGVRCMSGKLRVVSAVESSWSCACGGGGGVGEAGMGGGSGWSSLRSCSGPLWCRQYSGLPGAAAAAAAMEDIISSSLSSSSICTVAVESGYGSAFWGVVASCSPRACGAMLGAVLRSAACPIWSCPDGGCLGGLPLRLGAAFCVWLPFALAVMRALNALRADDTD
eukprot:5289678-Amphidinium_carterae.3